jgi:UDP-glucose 4-epimerase
MAKGARTEELSVAAALTPTHGGDGDRRNAVVTGGLGFVGQHLVRELLHRGQDVTILDRATSVQPPPGTKLVLADLADRRRLATALQGADIVFHLAANASGTLSVIDPRLDFETNTVGTFNMLEAALAAGVKRFVYVSSASVYGVPRRVPMDEQHPTRPFVPYGASKLSGEVTAFGFSYATGLPVVAARPFCVYGPGEDPHSGLVEVSRYLRWHLNNEAIHVVGVASGKTRDFVHVSDLVAGLLLIAEHGTSGEVYNVGSGTEISMRQLCQVIASVTGRPARIDELAEITEDTYRLVADITKLRGLGYVPRMSIQDGVRQVAAFLGDTPDLPEGETIFARGQHAEQSSSARMAEPTLGDRVA